MRIATRPLALITVVVAAASAAPAAAQLCGSAADAAARVDATIEVGRMWDMNAALGGLRYSQPLGTFRGGVTRGRLDLEVQSGVLSNPGDRFAGPILLNTGWGVANDMVWSAPAGGSLCATIDGRLSYHRYDDDTRLTSISSVPRIVARWSLGGRVHLDLGGGVELAASRFAGAIVAWDSTAGYVAADGAQTNWSARPTFDASLRWIGERLSFEAWTTAGRLLDGRGPMGGLSLHYRPGVAH